MFLELPRQYCWPFWKGRASEGLGCISNGMRPSVFFQSCWHHSCPLLVSHRPAAGPGASSMPC